MSKETPFVADSPRRPARRAWCMADRRRRVARGVLTTDVQIALACSDGVTGDGHRLDHREGIVLHQHPVLERSGLGLVGVAYQVSDRVRRVGHRFPLDPGGEGRAAPSSKTGCLDLGHHRRRPHLHRRLQGLIAAGLQVGVEGSGIHRPHPLQESEVRFSCLGHRRDVVSTVGRDYLSVRSQGPRPGIHGDQDPVFLPGPLDVGRRGSVALSQAG